MGVKNENENENLSYYCTYVKMREKHKECLLKQFSNLLELFSVNYFIA